VAKASLEASSNDSLVTFSATALERRDVDTHPLAHFSPFASFPFPQCDLFACFAAFDFVCTHTFPHFALSRESRIACWFTRFALFFFYIEAILFLLSLA
jgi:hypothetical protein